MSTSTNDEQRWAQVSPHLQYEVITGSTLYRLNQEGSDVDRKGIFELPLTQQFHLGTPLETVTCHEPSDIEAHSMKKTFLLLQSQNPTVLEMLWAPDDKVLQMSEAGRLLRDNRSLFVSRNVYDSFGGYAKQQLMRIKAGLNQMTDDDKIEHLSDTVLRMLNSFPNKYSEAENGTLSLNRSLLDNRGNEQLDLCVDYASISLSQLKGMVSELNQTVLQYNKMGKRNRKKDDKLFKHAMHLMRLLITGTELLETGELQVERTKDREYLLAIRNEKYTWEEIFGMVAEQQAKLDYAYRHTVLPQTVDPSIINQLYKDMMLDIHREVC